jgi:hypothetical protein
MTPEWHIAYAVWGTAALAIAPVAFGVLGAFSARWHRVEHSACLRCLLIGMRVVASVIGFWDIAVLDAAHSSAWWTLIDTDVGHYLLPWFVCALLVASDVFALCLDTRWPVTIQRLPIQLSSVAAVAYAILAYNEGVLFSLAMVWITGAALALRIVESCCAYTYPTVFSVRSRPRPPSEPESVVSVVISPPSIPELGVTTLS